MTTKVKDIIDTIKKELKQLEEDIKNNVPRKKWVMPFHIGNDLPINFVTNTNYKGFNIYVLTKSAVKKGFAKPQWAGWNQCIRDNKRIRFDERKNGTQIIIPMGKSKEVEDPITKEKEIKRWTSFQHKYVFNIEQTEGHDYKATLPDTTPKTKEVYNLLDKIKEQWNLKIKEGTRAYYSNNSIVMPPLNKWKGNDEEKNNQYLSVLMHELIHWTGESSRLNRKSFKEYSDSLSIRAEEELVAEIGSAILSTQFNIEINLRDDHVKYIHDWNNRLNRKDRSEERFLMHVTTEASKAVQFIMEHNG